MHASGRVVFYSRTKPVPSGLDELQFVQSGPFFDPPTALADLLDTIQQILSHPFCVPIPLNVGSAVFY
jgi:hypothetical protein